MQYADQHKIHNAESAVLYLHDEKRCEPPQCRRSEVQTPVV